MPFRSLGGSGAHERVLGPAGWLRPHGQAIELPEWLVQPHGQAAAGDPGEAGQPAATALGRIRQT
jgi:hypothetical protein